MAGPNKGVREFVTGGIAARGNRLADKTREKED